MQSLLDYAKWSGFRLFGLLGELEVIDWFFMLDDAIQTWCFVHPIEAAVVLVFWLGGSAVLWDAQRERLKGEYRTYRKRRQK